MDASHDDRNEDARVIAVPSTSDEGLAAHRSAHFGRAAMFTLVTVGDGGIRATDTTTNPPHEATEHGYAAGMLANRGVTDVIVSGIGRPMIDRLDAVGIASWKAEGETVGEAVAAWLRGDASRLGDEDVHEHHDEHHGHHH